jgi:hypothetical protein
VQLSDVTKWAVGSLNALPALRATLEREFAEPAGSVVHNDEVTAA